MKAHVNTVQYKMISVLYNRLYKMYIKQILLNQTASKRFQGSFLHPACITRITKKLCTSSWLYTYMTSFVTLLIIKTCHRYHSSTFVKVITSTLKLASFSPNLESRQQSFNGCKSRNVTISDKIKTAQETYLMTIMP